MIKDMASQNKSKAERKQSEETKQALDAKKFNRNVIIVVAVFVVAIIIVLLFNSNLFYTKTSAININGTKYSAVDFNYYYVNEYNSVCQSIVDSVGEDMAAYYTPSSSIPLSEQIYDTETGKTWEEFLTERTIDKMVRVTALCDAAEAAGYELSEDELSQVNSDFVYLNYYAAYYYGMDVNSYLVYMYGERMTEEIYRENRTRMLLASSYSTYIYDGFEYTADELVEEYAANADDLDYISFHAMLVYADVSETDVDTAMENAKEQAEYMASQIVDDDTFSGVEMNYVMSNAQYFSDTTYTSGVTYTNQGSDVPELFRDWLTESGRKYGDVGVFEYDGDDTSDTCGYYIVMYVDREDNNYNSVNGYYLLISPAELSADDYETTEEYNEAVATVNENCEGLIDTMYTEWTDGVYETMEDLVADYTYELSSYGSLDQIGVNDVTSSLASWFFDSSRKEGDYEKIQDSNGYYILFFYGEDDTVANNMADENLRNADYEEWEDGISENYGYKTSWTMRFTRSIVAMGG